MEVIGSNPIAPTIVAIAYEHSDPSGEVLAGPKAESASPPRPASSEEEHGHSGIGLA